MSIEDRVQAIINYAGESTTYREQTGEVRNATTLKKEIAYTDHTLTVHFRLYKDIELSGMIQEGDLELRIAAKDIAFNPTENDKVLRNGAEYNIVKIDTRKHRNVLAEYICIIRGSRAKPAL